VKDSALVTYFISEDVETVQCLSRRLKQQLKTEMQADISVPVPQDDHEWANESEKEGDDDSNDSWRYA